MCLLENDPAPYALVKSPQLGNVGQRRALGDEAVDRLRRIGIAERDAAEHHPFLGQREMGAHGLVHRRPGRLRTGGEAPFVGEQQDRLQEHADIGPLPGSMLRSIDRIMPTGAP